MNTLETNNINEEGLVECPYCLVYSIALSSQELTSVNSGQSMIALCPVCNKEVSISYDN